MAVEIRRVRASNASAMTLTGTNTYVLTSGRESIVVDPGPFDPAHQDGVVAISPRVQLIISTHRHPDHTGAVDVLSARTHAPARALSAQWCRRADPFVDGEEVLLGGERLRILATPGHTSDSLSVFVPSEGALLTGDTVLGGSTTVLDHPDGTLADYLDSLDRLAALGATRILPGHGEPIDDPAAALAKLRQHRLDRLEQVRGVLADIGAAPSLDPALVERVAQAVYPSVAAQQAARLSVAAQLAYLVR